MTIPKTMPTRFSDTLALPAALRYGHQQETTRDSCSHLYLAHV